MIQRIQTISYRGLPSQNLEHLKAIGCMKRHPSRNLEAGKLYILEARAWADARKSIHKVTLLATTPSQLLTEREAQTTLWHG
jgi:hypothetical protein